MAIIRWRGTVTRGGDGRGDNGQTESEMTSMATTQQITAGCRGGGFRKPHERKWDSSGGMVNKYQHIHAEVFGNLFLPVQHTGTFASCLLNRIRDEKAVFIIGNLKATGPDGFCK
jgi:hypothetical protein